jgi:hypothetical protein
MGLPKTWREPENFTSPTRSSAEGLSVKNLPHRQLFSCSVTQAKSQEIIPWRLSSMIQQITNPR